VWCCDFTPSQLHRIAAANRTDALALPAVPVVSFGPRLQVEPALAVLILAAVLLPVAVAALAGVPINVNLPIDVSIVPLILALSLRRRDHT
jgi:hypothetical protein